MAESWRGFRMLLTSWEVEGKMAGREHSECLRVIVGECSDIVENYIFKMQDF